MTGILRGAMTRSTGPLEATRLPGKESKPLFLSFTDVTEEDALRLAAAKSKDEVRQLLKDCMKIDQPEGFLTEILADMHYHNYNFCASRDFSPERTSAFLSIMRLTLEEATGSRLPVDEAFDLFKGLLLRHSVERPPLSIVVFSFEDIKAIMDHVHNTFFRHYRLYMYAFMTHCELSIRVDGHAAGPAFPPIIRPKVLKVEDEVDPRAQPEFAHLFRPSEHEQAEADLRRLRQGDQASDSKASLIKQRVDAGVKKLMEGFHQKLSEQDEQFRTMLETG